MPPLIIHSYALSSMSSRIGWEYRFITEPDDGLETHCRIRSVENSSGRRVPGEMAETSLVSTAGKRDPTTIPTEEVAM